MTTNVHIRHLREGKLIEERRVHNTWTMDGHAYLAQFLGVTTYNSSNPPLPTDVLLPERNDRIKYFGLGIGSVKRDTAATAPPLSTSYPAGAAQKSYPPNFTPAGFTAGNEYDDAYPIYPKIRTLELPVRKSGGSAAYPGVVTDTWIFGPPALHLTHQSLFDVTVRVLVDATAGNIVYGPFTSMPVTEAALFSSAANPHQPYNQALAYVTFDKLVLDNLSQVEFIWSVRFG